MSKNSKTRIVKLPKSSDEQQHDPDWDCPLKFGFFVGQELETNFYAIVKVENLFESVDEIFKAFDEMAPVSFKNHEGRISHCTLIFYGSEAKCLRFLDHLLGERKSVFLEKNSAEDQSETSSSDNADIVDLTSSPEKKKPKQIHGEEPGPSNEDLNLKTRQGKSNSEKALQEHGDQSKNDKETASSRRESSALTDELTLELMIQSITELEQKLNKLSEKVDESREELSAKLQDLVDIMSVKTQNRQAEIMPEKLVEAELACQFMKILVTQRASQEWREKIKKQKIAGVTSEQERNIKKLFLFGTITVGSFMRGLAREIFGEERLRKTLLGDSGEFLKGIKQQIDRSEIFSTDEELLLTNILKLIDPVFFSSRETYKLLVREKINSYGRDLKKIPFEKGPNFQQKDITRYFNKISRPNQETTQMAQEKEKDLRQEDNQASSSKSGQDLDPSQENANKSIPKCSWWTKSSK